MNRRRAHVVAINAGLIKTGDTLPPFHAPITADSPAGLPTVICSEHGPVDRSYTICPHVMDGAPIDHFERSTPIWFGIVLCSHCANAEVHDEDEIRRFARSLRQVCQLCAQKAGLP